MKIQRANGSVSFKNQGTESPEGAEFCAENIRRAARQIEATRRILRGYFRPATGYAGERVVQQGVDVHIDIYARHASARDARRIARALERAAREAKAFRRAAEEAAQERAAADRKAAEERPSQVQPLPKPGKSVFSSEKGRADYIKSLVPQLMAENPGMSRREARRQAVAYLADACQMVKEQGHLYRKLADTGKGKTGTPSKSKVSVSSRAKAASARACAGTESGRRDTIRKPRTESGPSIIIRRKAG